MATRCTWRCDDASTRTRSNRFCQIAAGERCFDEEILDNTATRRAVQHKTWTGKHTRVSKSTRSMSMLASENVERNWCACAILHARAPHGNNREIDLSCVLCQRDTLQSHFDFYVNRFFSFVPKAKRRALIFFFLDVFLPFSRLTIDLYWETCDRIFLKDTFIHFTISVWWSIN